jgi:hypothetical protein
MSRLAGINDVAQAQHAQPSGLHATDGGAFTFGDAQFSGSMGGQHLNKPVVGGATPG